MASRSRSRGRTHTRSPVSASRRARTQSPSRSPQRSVSPRSLSRSRTPSDRGRIPPRNGRGRSASPSRSRSPGHRYRDRSYSRSPVRDAPAPKSSKIVVEKLTKNVTDAHLREIFGTYGPIRDVDLPMNRQFMTNRGTAYILYDATPHAENAIAHMHEAQLDGAVISVSIVLPRRKFSRSPPPARPGGAPFEQPTPAAEAVPHQLGIALLRVAIALPCHDEARRPEVGTEAEEGDGTRIPIGHDLGQEVGARGAGAEV